MRILLSIAFIFLSLQTPAQASESAEELYQRYLIEEAEYAYGVCMRSLPTVAYVGTSFKDLQPQGEIQEGKNIIFRNARSGDFMNMQFSDGGLEHIYISIKAKNARHGQKFDHDCHYWPRDSFMWRAKGIDDPSYQKYFPERIHLN